MGVGVRSVSNGATARPTGSQAKKNDCAMADIVTPLPDVAQSPHCRPPTPARRRLLAPPPIPPSLLFCRAVADATAGPSAKACPEMAGLGLRAGKEGRWPGRNPPAPVTVLPCSIYNSSVSFHPLSSFEEKHVSPHTRSGCLRGRFSIQPVAVGYKEAATHQGSAATCPHEGK